MDVIEQAELSAINKPGRSEKVMQRDASRIKRRFEIYRHRIKSGNGAVTGRSFGISRARTAQVFHSVHRLVCRELGK